MLLTNQSWKYYFTTYLEISVIIKQKNFQKLAKIFNTARYFCESVVFVEESKLTINYTNHTVLIWY